MKYKLVALVLLASCFSACRRGEAAAAPDISLYTDSIASAGNLLELHPPMRQGAINFEAIVDSVSYLPLFTNDSILIAGISDIKALGDTLFIADYRLGKIFAFNLEGQCIGSISARGEGPEDYKRLCGFDVDARNRLLYLLDGDRGKVHVYTPSLDLREVIKLPCSFVDHLALLPSGKLLLELGFRDYDPEDKVSPNLVLYDMETEQVDSTFFHYARKTGINFRPQAPIAFSSYKDGVYYWPPLSHSVYFYDGTMQKAVDCDLGEYALPAEVLTLNNSEALALMRERKYAYVDCFFAFRDWYYVRISRATSSAHYFYHKRTQEGYLDVSFLKQQPDKEIIMPDLYKLSDTLCCSFIHPQQYMALLEADGQSAADVVDMEDNPVLVFYKLKS